MSQMLGWHVFQCFSVSVGRAKSKRGKRRNSVWIKARELQETFVDTLTPKKNRYFIHTYLLDSHASNCL